MDQSSPRPGTLESWVNTPLSETQMLNLLATVIRDAEESVLITNADLNEPGPYIVFVNPAFTRLTGYEPEEAVGRSPRMLQGAKTDHNLLKELRRSLEETGHFHGSTYNYRKDGGEYLVEWDISAVVDSEGKITHYVSIQRDISDRQRYKEQLQTASEEVSAARHIAEESSAVKTRFMANLSREVSTTITSILGVANTLMDELNLTQSQRDQLQEMISIGDPTLKLMSDILELSRLENGQLTVKSEPFNVEELLKDTVESHQPQALEKGLRVELAFLTEMPGSAMLDPLLTRQIISNLISNAILCSERENVLVRASYSAVVDKIYFDVEYRGAEIPEDQLDRVFEVFSTIDTSDNERQHGGDIGLPISQNLARSMNGDVKAHSRLGEGSMFRVTLPSIFMSEISDQTVSQSNDKSEQLPDLAGLTVLAADDSVDNLKLLKRSFDLVGADTLLAESGLKALEIFEQRGVDVIILDVMMPGLTGYETVKLLRRLPGGDRVPILMLSAHDRDSERDNSIEAGADDYISKPFKPSELYAVIAKLSNRSGLKHVDDQFAMSGKMNEIRLEFLANREVSLNKFLDSYPDRPELDGFVHQLVGAGSFGHTELTNRAREIERALESKMDTAGITNLLRSTLNLVHAAQGVGPS
jgi:PAS domain S-box-containing protein